MGSDDGGLDVDGVVPHPPQLHGLLQRSHHEQSVVSLCVEREGRHVAADGQLRDGGQACGGWGLTSVGVRELGAAEEAQVPRPGPDRLSVSKAEPGVEVIGLENLLAVAAVVAAAVVSAVHPDLRQEHERQPRC